MGSVRRAPRTNRWEARYRDPLGGQRTKTFDTKADARVFLSGMETSMARGTWREPGRSRAKFSRVAAEWLANNPTKRATTYARDATVIRTHLGPVLGDMPINHIQPPQVQEVTDRMVERGLGPKTIRTDYGVLRAIFSWAMATDIIDRSPCRGIRLPEMLRQRRSVVSAEEIERLVAAMPAEYRATVLLGGLGLRQGEVFGLRVGAVDFLRRTLTVRATMNEVEGNFVEGAGKTLSSRRTISVPTRIIDELSAHLARTGRTDPEDLVFQAPGGGPVRATNFRNRVYDPALHRTGLEGLSLHAFATRPATCSGSSAYLWRSSRSASATRPYARQRTSTGRYPRGWTGRSPRSSTRCSVQPWTRNPLVQRPALVVQMWCRSTARRRCSDTYPA